MENTKVTYFFSNFLQTINMVSGYWEEKNYISDVLEWESIRIYHINHLFIRLLVLREVR